MNDDFTSRFHKHLPRTRDTTLLVLKGHLLMEELVNDLVVALLPNPAAFDPATIRLHSRIRLAEALLPADRGSVFEAALKLNTLRNKLAHHLDHPQVTQLLTDFILLAADPSRLVFGPSASSAQASRAKKIVTPTRLRKAIESLCGALYGRQELLLKGRAPRGIPRMQTAS